MSTGSDTPFTAGDYALWVQPYGPNSTVYYLGCHTPGDITEPLGDVERILCPDPARRRAWVSKGSYQGPPGLVTMSIEGYLTRVVDWLEKINCPATIFVSKSLCDDRRDNFNNFERSWVVFKATPTQRTLTQMGSRDENPGPSMVSAEFSGEPPVLRMFTLAGVRISTSEPRALNDVFISGDDACATGCGPAAIGGDSFVAVGSAVSGAGSVVGTANVIYSTTGGSVILTASSDPFGPGESIAAGVRVRLTHSANRWIVARGTTDAANPAEIAYSDDSGATWTNVNVGSTNGQYAAGRRALTIDPNGNVWLATSGGYIYKSSDSGLTWEAKESAGVTSGIYYGMVFADAQNAMAVAASGVVAKTIDGGDVWSAATVVTGTPTLNTVAYSDTFYWVGTATGKLFYSGDDGTTWSERSFSGSGTGSLKDIEFMPGTGGLFGMFVHDTAGGVGRIFYTIAGGALANGNSTWLQLDGGTPTNSGLNAIAIAGTDLAYAVGNAQGGTAMIVKVTPKFG